MISKIHLTDTEIRDTLYTHRILLSLHRCTLDF